MDIGHVIIKPSRSDSNGNGIPPAVSVYNVHDSNDGVLFD